MKFRVELTRRARGEVNAIHDWLASHSEVGAKRWYGRFVELVRVLSDTPEIYGFAPEAGDPPQNVRQATFKTPKGRRYRALFVIRGTVVFVVTVRGPGQPPVELSEFDD
jgi:plasmid stabilization system protein ParE